MMQNPVVKRFLLFLGLVIIILGVWVAFAFQPKRRPAPAESTGIAAPPVEEDYQRALIARMKEKSASWPGAADGEIPDLTLIQSDDSAGAETVSLRALIKLSSQPTAVILFYPSTEAIGGVSILRWFKTAGDALNPIFIDFGRDTEASAVFARRFAAPMPIYRLASSDDAARLRITDPAMQLPFLMLIPTDASTPHCFSAPFEVDELLDQLEEPTLLGAQGVSKLRANLLKEAEQSPAKFVEHFLDLHRTGEYDRATFLAVNNPRAIQDPLFLFARASVALNEGQPEYAGFKARLAPEKLTGQAAAFAHYLTAWECFNRGDYAAAVPEYQAALAGDLKSASGHVWYWMARALQYLDKHDEAEKAFRNALQQGFESVDCHHFLAHCLEQRRDRGALEMYRKMLPLAPWEGKLHWHIGDLLHDQGQFAAAAAAWQRGMAADPPMDDNFTYGGRCLLWKLHDDTAAITALTEAIRLTPNYTHEYYKKRRAELWNNLGFAYMTVGDAPRAVACMLEATNHYDEQPYVWANLGQAYEKLGRTPQALWAYEQGLKKTPRSPRLSFMRQAVERLRSGVDRRSPSTEDAGGPNEAPAPIEEPPIREAM